VQAGEDTPHRRTVCRDHEGAAAQQEHAGDAAGVVRRRAREVRVDERVADREGEGGREENSPTRTAVFFVDDVVGSALLITEGISSVRLFI